MSVLEKFFVRRLPVAPVLRSLLLAGLLGLVGCASPAARPNRAPELTAKMSAALARDLGALSPEVDAWEARTLAEAACAGSAELAVQYRATRPAWLHNMLVNAGLRPRGLCYHWANDLGEKLARVPLRTVEIHYVVARLATPREHNALVVTQRGAPFSEGLVLDAWRRSGELTWMPVTADHYPWQLVPP